MPSLAELLLGLLALVGVGLRAVLLVYAAVRMPAPRFHLGAVEQLQKLLVGLLGLSGGDAFLLDVYLGVALVGPQAALLTGAAHLEEHVSCVQAAAAGHISGERAPDGEIYSISGFCLPSLSSMWASA